MEMETKVTIFIVLATIFLVLFWIGLSLDMKKRNSQNDDIIKWLKRLNRF
jgi:hypothetical protein